MVKVESMYCLLVGGVCVAATVMGPHSPPSERLDKALRALPTTGSIEATITQATGIKSVTAVGYDFGSGAWYFANENAVCGVEPSGRAFYRKTKQPESLVFNPTDDRLETAAVTRLAFPWIELERLKRNPSKIVDISDSPDSPGTLIVRTHESAPGKDSVQAGKTFVQVMKIDSNGRVLEVGYEPDPKASAAFYTHEENFEGPLPLSANPDFVITSRTWGADSSRWTADYVIAHARQVGVAPLKIEPIVPPLLPANAIDQDPADARWSRTLFMTGAVVCAVGVFAWIRARRRA